MKTGIWDKFKGRFQSGGIGRHVSWLLLQSGVEAGSMTVASLLAARWFGPVMWGQLGLILAGVQLVTMFADGFYSSIVKDVADARANKDDQAAQLGWVLTHVSLAAMAMASVVMGMITYFAFDSKVSVIWVMLGVVLSITRGFRASLDGLYRGFQEFRTSAIAGGICTLLMAGCIIAATLNGHRISFYLSIMAAGSILNCCWLMISFFRKYRIGHSAEIENLKSRVKEFLNYSIPLALRGLLGFLFLKVNIWFLGWLATENDAGQFRLAEQVLTLPGLMLSSILAAVAPRISMAKLQSQAALGDLLAKTNGMVLLLTAPMALAFLFNGPVFKVLFPDYRLASDMLVYFAPAMAFQGLGFAASVFLIQGGKPGVAFMMTLIPGLFNLVAVYVGFRLGGVLGLTAGTALVHFLTYSIITFLNCRLFQVPFRIKFH